MWFLSIAVIFILFEGMATYDAEAEQERRLNQFRTVCEKYQDDLTYEHAALFTKIHKDNYFQLKSGKLSMCIPEMEISHKIIQYIRQQYYSEITNQTLEEKGDESGIFKSTHNSILVQHPLIRILHIYIQNFVKSSLFEMLDLKIKSWLSIRKDKLAPVEGEISVNYRGFPIVSFRQFINFLNKCPSEIEDCKAIILDGPGFFWTPFWQHCSPCLNGLDSIITMEHYMEDMAYLKAKAGLDANIKMEPDENQAPAEDVLKFYSRVPKIEIYQLYKKYQLDHELFGYDPTEIIEMGLDDKI